MKNTRLCSLFRERNLGEFREMRERQRERNEENKRILGFYIAAKTAAFWFRGGQGPRACLMDGPTRAPPAPYEGQTCLGPNGSSDPGGPC